MGPVLSADWFWPWGSKGFTPWSVFGYFLLTKKVTSSALRFERNKDRMRRNGAEKGAGRAVYRIFIGFGGGV